MEGRPAQEGLGGRGPGLVTQGRTVFFLTVKREFLKSLESVRNRFEREILKSLEIVLRIFSANFSGAGLSLLEEGSQEFNN